MRHALTASIVGFVVAGALVSGISEAHAQPRTRNVYVSVVDKQGLPVTDLQAADFEVKVGGKAQDVVTVQPATVPFRIALIVADGGTGAFQRGLALFMQRLLGKAEFSLTSVIVQPEKIVDYTPDAATLSAGLGRLGPRGTADRRPAHRGHPGRDEDCSQRDQTAGHRRRESWRRRRDGRLREGRARGPSEERRHPVCHFHRGRGSQGAVSGPVGHLLRAGPGCRCRPRGQRVQPRAGARRRFEGIRRTSRSGHLDDDVPVHRAAGE